MSTKTSYRVLVARGSNYYEYHPDTPTGRAIPEDKLDAWLAARDLTRSMVKLRPVRVGLPRRASENIDETRRRSKRKSTKGASMSCEYQVRARTYPGGKMRVSTSCHSTKAEALKAAKRKQFATVVGPNGKVANCSGGRCDSTGLAGRRRRKRRRK